LDEVRPRPEADLQHPFVVVASELSEGMDKGLVCVTPLLYLVEVLSREFLPPARAAYRKTLDSKSFGPRF